MKTNAFLVVSQWNNDVSWVSEYTNDYIIYDKSNTLDEGDKILKVPNVGHNIHDIFHFIYNHYDNLPELVAFLEGNPFDHCNREKLNILLKNTFFTSLESYENVPDSTSAIKCSDTGWMEINNSWYIGHIEHIHNTRKCKYRSYDDFMLDIFKNYVRPQWVRFAPGGQYLVEKTRLLFYSKQFWKKLLDLVSHSQHTPEAHMCERALWTIFNCCYQEK